ncbi:MAG: hypothetical protein AABX74_00480 [Nanoarchaeota archaeon]
MEKINTRNFFKELKKAVPEFDLYDRPYVHNTLINLRCRLRDLILESGNKQNTKPLIKRATNFISKCWYHGSNHIQNAVMVSFFEDIPKRLYKEIRHYLTKDLAKEIRRYQKAWDKFCHRK